MNNPPTSGSPVPPQGGGRSASGPRRPARTPPFKAPEAPFLTGVRVETAANVVRLAELAGFPGFMDYAAVGMAPLDRGYSGSLMIWRCVSEAFALEEYLKTLAVLDHSTHLAKTHDLHELYNDLKPDTQELVRYMFVQFEKHHPGWASGMKAPAENMQTFDVALDRSSNAFIQLRYIHETIPGHRKEWFARPIMVAARQAVVRIRQDWGHHTAHLLSTYPIP